MARASSDAEFPTDRWKRRLDVPEDRRAEILDVRGLAAPEPLTRTLEQAADIEAGHVLLQVNERAPKFLYPKLDDRGFEHRTETFDEGVVTAIWR